MVRRRGEAPFEQGRVDVLQESIVRIRARPEINRRRNHLAPKLEKIVEPFTAVARLTFLEPVALVNPLYIVPS
jgi:hypothetical protein